MANLRIIPKRFARRYRQNAKELLKLTRDFPDHPSPEEIHDVRVTTRRVEAARRLMPKGTRSLQASRKFDLSLKSLLKSTTRVRDLDILMKTLEPDKGSLPAEVFRSLDDERSDAANSARAAMKAFSNAPVPALDSSRADRKKLSRRLRRRIKRRSQIVVGLLREVLKDESKVVELHSLRKEVKKLRYLLELADKSPPESSVLTKWQDALGSVHDLDIATSYLQDKRWQFEREEALSELTRRRHLSYLRFVRKYRVDSVKSLGKSEILRVKPAS